MIITSKKCHTHTGKSSKDLGIIELSKPLNYSAYIRPVKLPSKSSNDYANQMASVCGIGFIGKLNACLEIVTNLEFNF